MNEPQPLITFHLESWESYFDDPRRGALWLAHHEELAQRASWPMAPDIPFYQFLSAHGMLQILTARSAGAMVGYCLCVVKPHPHYGVLCGFEDSYFLEAAFRGMGAGKKMLEEAIAAMKARGVRQVYFMDRASAPLGALFTSLGFAPSHTCYSKSLEA